MSERSGFNSNRIRLSLSGNEPGIENLAKGHTNDYRLATFAEWPPELQAGRK